MALPIVVVPSGGLPVTEAANGLGLPLEVAANGFGTPVTYVASGGLPVSSGSLVDAALSSAGFSQNDLGGTLIGDILGVPTSVALSLVDDAGGKVALSGSRRLVVGMTETTAAGPLSVTLRQTRGSQAKDTVLAITVAGRDAATTALLAQIVSAPSVQVAGVYDRLIKGLKADGAYDCWDFIGNVGVDRQTKNLNWKAPTLHVASETGTVVDTVRGRKSDGSSGIVTSGFNPALHAVRATPYDFTLAYQCWDEVISGTFDVGTATGTLRLYGRNGGVLGGRLNGGADTAIYTVASSFGMLFATRISATQVTGSKHDGDEGPAQAQAGNATFSSGPLKWCGGVINGTYSPRGEGAVLFGNPTLAQRKATAHRFEQFYRELGVWADENTRGPPTLSTNIANNTSSSQCIPAGVYTPAGRLFGANQQVVGLAAGSDPEAPPAQCRVQYSDDDGATWNFCGSWLPNVGTESVLDPHLQLSPDGTQVWLTFPYNGTGGRRSTWVVPLLNPDAGSTGSFTWGTPIFCDYGFVGASIQDGPELLYTVNEPIIGIAPPYQPYQGKKLAALRVCNGNPVHIRISNIPNATPEADKNQYDEPSLDRRPDGTLRCYFRTRNGVDGGGGTIPGPYNYVDATRDGLTWGTPAPITSFATTTSRMHWKRSPGTGKLYADGDLNYLERRDMAVTLLADDGLTAVYSYVYDSRGATNPRPSYPDTTWKQIGGVWTHVSRHDCGRGKQVLPGGSPPYVNDLVTTLIPEPSLLAGAGTKTAYTQTS